MQSKKHSLVESLTNTGIGFGINYIANLLVLPLFGAQVTPKTAFGISVVFTVISVVRGYVLRRFFTKRTEKVVDPTPVYSPEDEELSIP